MGCKDSLGTIRLLLIHNHAAKDDYAKALRAYQIYEDDTRSDQRDIAMALQLAEEAFDVASKGSSNILDGINLNNMEDETTTTTPIKVWGNATNRNSNNKDDDDDNSSYDALYGSGGELDNLVSYPIGCQREKHVLERCTRPPTQTRAYILLPSFSFFF